MSFTFYFTLNIAIFCVVTLLVLAFAEFMLAKQKDDFGITGILAIITFAIAISAFVFVGDPAEENSMTAKIFGIISGAITYVLLLIQPIINFIKNIPVKRKARKEAKKNKVIERIANKTRNILDL